MTRPTRLRLLLVLLVALACLLAAWAARDRIWPACSWNLRPAFATAEASLVFFGDSHICRAGLDAAYGSADLAWRGLEGATAGQLAARADQALAFRPRRILLIAGTNDIVQGRTPEQFAADYARLVALLAPAQGLALVTVPPCSHPLCAHPTQQARLREFNRTIARTAKERGATLIVLHAAVAAPDGSLPPALTTDGIHLSAEGYARFHALVRPWVESGPAAKD